MKSQNIIIIALLAVIAIGGGGFAFHQYQQAQEREKEARQAEVKAAQQEGYIKALEEQKKEAAETAKAEKAAKAEKTAAAQKASTAKIQQSGGYTMFNFSRSDYISIVRRGEFGGCDLAQVYDKDGWTNIRASASTSSRILCRVKSGSYLLVASNDCGDHGWASAYDTNGNYLGEIHTSRLKFCGW